MFLFIIFFIFVPNVGSVFVPGVGNVIPGGIQPKNIFLLAGQSNMAGRGGVYNDPKTHVPKWDGKVPPECTPNPNVLTLNLKTKPCGVGPGMSFSAQACHSGRTGMSFSDLSWDVARDPLHKEIDSSKTCGVGPGMPFSNRILARLPTFGVIGLVPCAVGGTKIEKWQKGTFLYNQLVDRARAARQSSGGRIRALLWYQGESDCGMQDSVRYRGRLEKFFNDVRQDLNSPDLPILLVLISTGEGKFVRTVRAAQGTINLKNVVNVDSMGSTYLPDHLHLDTKSAVRVGQMLADTFIDNFYGH